MEEIYNLAVAKIKELELQQKKIINDFILKLKQRKIKEIKKDLARQ